MQWSTGADQRARKHCPPRRLRADRSERARPRRHRRRRRHRRPHHRRRAAAHRAPRPRARPGARAAAGRRGDLAVVQRREGARRARARRRDGGRRRAHGAHGLPRPRRATAVRLQPRSRWSSGWASARTRCGAPTCRRCSSRPSARASCAPGSAASGSTMRRPRVVAPRGWRATSRATSWSPPTAPTRACARHVVGQPVERTYLGYHNWNGLVPDELALGDPDSWTMHVGDGRAGLDHAGARRASTSSSTSRSPTRRSRTERPQEALREHFDGWDPSVQRLIDGLDPAGRRQRRHPLPRAARPGSRGAGWRCSATPPTPPRPTSGRVGAWRWRTRWSSPDYLITTSVGVRRRAGALLGRAGAAGRRHRPPGHAAGPLSHAHDPGRHRGLVRRAGRRATVPTSSTASASRS